MQLVKQHLCLPCPRNHNRCAAEKQHTASTLQQLAAGSADANVLAAAEATQKHEATRHELDGERALVRTLQASLKQADDMLEKSEQEQVS